MKLKYFFTAIVAALSTVFVSCSDDFEATYLDEVSVSSSFITFAAEGGNATIEVNAKGDWQIKSLPEWVTVSSANGSAGATVVTFSATTASETREANAVIECAGKQQSIKFFQQTEKVELPVSPCSEVLAGPDSKSYRIKGICTKIANTQYGNFYINDGTGEVYIYGTVDETGSYNWAKFGIEVGDEVIVEGPKTTYNGTVELVDATFIGINKSLIKVETLDPEDATLPLEGGKFTVALSNKGNGVSVAVPEEAQSWLSVNSIVTGATSTVVFTAAPNDGGDRSVELVFKTTDGKKEYTATTILTQKGAIVACSVAEFNAAAVGSTQYRLTGIVSKVVDATKGRFYIYDYSGETYVYNYADCAAKGVKAGDIITVVGKRDQYKETIEMTGGVIEDVNPVTEVSIADFLTKADDKNVYYMVSGVIDEIANDQYGNIYIKDDNGNRLYVYGCYPGWGATGDARKGVVAAKEMKVGDILTVVGPKSTYKDVPQVNGGYYFSHTPAN